jgi:hypothetical protein
MSLHPGFGRKENLMKSLAFLALFPLLLTGCIFDSRDSSGAPATLSPGVYATSASLTLTEEEDGVDGEGTLNGLLLLRKDGTFYQRATLTLPALDLEGLRVYEGRGDYQVRADTVEKILLEERFVDYLEPGLSEWEEAEEEEDGGKSALRNITATSFETFNGEKWIVWTKVSGASDLVVDENPLLTHPELGLSLNYPVSWAAFFDQRVGSTLFEVYLQGPAASGMSPTLGIIDVSGEPAKTLAMVMNEVAQSLETQLGATILSKGVRTRGETKVAEIQTTWTSSGTSHRQKLLIFEKGDRLRVLYFSDAAARFDGNTEMHAIDSSLTFF